MYFHVTSIVRAYSEKILTIVPKSPKTSYHTLPLKSLESAEDPVDDHTDFASKSNRRLSIKAILFLCVAFVQFAIVVYFCLAASKCAKGRHEFIKKYGRNPIYQLLDHKYDYLQNETGYSSVVMSSIGIENGHEGLGSLIMLVP